MTMITVSMETVITKNVMAVFYKKFYSAPAKKKGEPNRVESKCVSGAKRQMVGEHVPHVQRHETWGKRNEKSRPC